MRNRLWAPLLAVAALLAAPAQAAQKKTDAADAAIIRKAIEANNAIWCAAQIKGDATGIANLFAEDGVELLARSGRTWKGRDSLLALWTRIMADGHPTAAVVTTTSLCAMGRTVAELGTYAYTFAPADSSVGPNTVRGRYCVVWRQQPGGEWRIFLDMGVPFDD